MPVIQSSVCATATAQEEAYEICSIQMNHKSNTTNISCSSPIKKATWVADQGTRSNNSDFFFLWNQIHMNEVINLFKKSIDSGKIIVKNASVSEFPDTPIEENW